MNSSYKQGVDAGAAAELPPEPYDISTHDDEYKVGFIMGHLDGGAVRDLTGMASIAYEAGKLASDYLLPFDRMVEEFADAGAEAVAELRKGFYNLDEDIDPQDDFYKPDHI